MGLTNRLSDRISSIGKMKPIYRLLVKYFINHIINLSSDRFPDPIQSSKRVFTTLDTFHKLESPRVVRKVNSSLQTYVQSGLTILIYLIFHEMFIIHNTIQIVNPS